MSREKRPSQASVVLAELRKGPVHTNDLRRLFIANPSERIRTLEDRGHDIRHDKCPRGRNANGVLYTLVRDAESHPVVAVSDDGQTYLLEGEAA